MAYGQVAPHLLCLSTCGAFLGPLELGVSKQHQRVALSLQHLGRVPQSLAQQGIKLHSVDGLLGGEEPEILGPQCP